MSMMAHVVRTDGGEVVGAGRLDVTQSGTSALESLYPTADGWVCLAVRTDDEIAALQSRLEVDILSDERFATIEARRTHREDLADVLRLAFEQRSTAYWLDAFRGSGVGLVVPVDSAFTHVFLNDAEQRRIGRVAETRHPQKGAVRELGHLVRISDTDMVPHRLAPDLGANTDEILSMLGCTPSEINALRSRGVVR
jgi:crotonobetainyl-CoA:carnitine CoA-transferase CaiB-like acyl-CoA transferase